MSSLLAPLCARPASHIAVFDERCALTWAEVLARGARTAHVLRQGRTSLEGARVALLGRQDAGWLASFLGILLAGGMAVPLSPAYPASELGWFGDDADAEAVIVSDEYRELASALAQDRRTLSTSTWTETTACAAPANVSDSDPAVLFYTSGTTGRPKGAILSHQNLGTHTRLIRDAWALGEADRLLHALPLHHLHGLVVSLLSVLSAGGSVRLMPRFDAAKVVEHLGVGDVSVFMAVPTMYQKLYELVRGDATRLAQSLRAPRLATSGSAALPVSLAEFWRNATGAIPLERYGMTEIGVAAANPLDPARRRAGTVGTALPTVELRVDPSTEELWVRGPSVFSGYFRRPEATALAFSPDGWFQTGDVVSLDDDGFVRIRGRTSQDILKSGGYKLSALEIEETLREHPAIADAAVIGVPDATWGERVVAIVELREIKGQLPLGPDELRSWAKTRLATYKTPRDFVIVECLPRNPMGKVIKAELRKRF